MCEEYFLGEFIETPYYLNDNFLNTFIPDFSYIFFIPLSYETIKIILIKSIKDDQLYWFSQDCPDVSTEGLLLLESLHSEQTIRVDDPNSESNSLFLSLQFYCIFYNCLIMNSNFLVVKNTFYMYWS